MFTIYSWWRIVDSGQGRWGYFCKLATWRFVSRWLQMCSISVRYKIQKAKNQNPVAAKIISTKRREIIEREITAKLVSKVQNRNSGCYLKWRNLISLRPQLLEWMHHALGNVFARTTSLAAIIACLAAIIAVSESDTPVNQMTGYHNIQGG